ncbi:MAG TPA: addiction module protein [Kiritimatiellia bacterium]|nr:addiction module protein [Kiritimatiellia bacterium]
MPTAIEIIDEVKSLPVEDRAFIVDSLLRTLNPPDHEMDQKWSAVAKARLDDLRSGRVRAIPGEEVFARIKRQSAT